MAKIELENVESLTNEQSALVRMTLNNTEIETKSDTFLSRDGTSPNQMEAALDMNSNRIMNLPTPYNAADAVRKIDMDALAAEGIGITTSGIVVNTSTVEADFATRAIIAGTGISVTNGNGVDGNITIAATGSSSALGDGTALLPSMAFASDSNTGIYRIASDNLGVAAGGSKILDVDSGGLDVTGTINATSDISSLTNMSAANLSTVGTVTASTNLKTGDGAVATPAMTFASDTNTGLYRIGADNLGIAANGAKVVDVATTGVSVTGTLTSTGALTGGSVTTAGNLSAANVSSSGQILSANGTVGAPSHSFTNDPDSGMYRIGADNIGLNVGGANIVNVSSAGVGITGRIVPSTVIWTNDGAVGTPTYSFSSDTDTGLYRIGTDNLGVAASGGKVLDISTAGLSVTGNTVTSGAFFANGGQITFPATQNASAGANTLDDYEEGTWTPVFTFATPGNLTVAYSTQQGGYTKVGRLVVLVGSVVTSTFTHTTAAGAAQITGLPFTSANIATQNYYATLQWQGINKTGGYSSVATRLVSNSTIMDFVAQGMNLGVSQVQATDTPTGGTLVLAWDLPYFTA